VQQEERQERALLRPAEGHRTPTAYDLERTQYAKLKTRRLRRLGHLATLHRAALERSSVDRLGRAGSKSTSAVAGR
jgi:hypothetical protein